MPEGAFYLWCSKDGVDGWELARELAEQSGLVVSPGELYGEDGRELRPSSRWCRATNDSSWPRRDSEALKTHQYDGLNE